eukprot:UN01323
MLKQAKQKQQKQSKAVKKLPKVQKKVKKTLRPIQKAQKRQFAITTTSSADALTPKATDFKLLPSAVKQLYGLNRLHLQQHPDTETTQRMGIRITVDTGGCSGFQYIFTKEELNNKKIIDYILESTPAYDPQNPPTAENPGKQSIFINDEDIYFIQAQQFVVVDDVSYPFLKDSEFEYKVELIRSGFGVINNPNVELACGCGTSFSKKGSAADV